MAEARTPGTNDDAQVRIDRNLLEALQEREHQLAEAQRLAHIGSWSWDLASDDFSWSDELFRILGLETQAFTPTFDAFLRRVHEDHRARVQRTVEDALGAEGSFEYDCPVLVDGGRERLIRARGEFVRDGAGEVVRAHGTIQDLTDWLVVQEFLAVTEGHLAALSTAVSEVVFLYERDGALRFSTAGLERALGYPAGSELGGDPWVLVHSGDVKRVRDSIAELCAVAGSTMTVEFRARHADGTWRTFEARGRNATDDRDIRATFVTARDISDIRAALDVAARHALTDPLTGLANRAALAARAQRALERAGRNGWTTAMLAIDIDAFQAHNERLGLQGGDQVLTEVAQRLERVFRPYDAVARPNDTVARLGGDEFLVLCEQVADANVAQALGRRVSDALGVPVMTQGGAAVLTAAVGIALSSPGDVDVEHLLRRAYAAMRQAKGVGPGTCEISDRLAGGDEQVSPGRFASDLAVALERDQLRLVYQPKIALDTGRISGAEALLRWEHPDRGLVSPLQFIPLAEETGLIIPVGAWVIQEACRQAAAWRASSSGRPDLVVSVNVSALQFGPDLIGVVSDALASAGLDPAALCVEVTETVLMTDVSAAIATLRALALLGVSVSIDDFGTGYSSLAYLKRLPLDELKIDKSFVDGLGTNPDDTAIVAAIVAMAHALDLRVVAEGVENAEQMERLRTLGCEQVQGYHCARPGPADAIDTLLLVEATATRRTRDPHGKDSPSPTAYRPERVLVVDDTADVRMLARMSLSAVGFDVYDADSGAGALAAARELAPDCVLLDLVMPDMTGLEVCRALRQDPVTAASTILMLTSNADARDKIEAFAAGADDYIVKPFSPRDLASRVRSAIGRRQGST